MARSTSVIDYRGLFTFDVPPEAVWSSIEHCERFETWWAWLREFRLEGARLEAGAVMYGVVSPPVPYTMRIRVALDRCSRPDRIDATVHGDLEGPACLVLEPAGDGTLVEVSWTVEMTQRAMRLAAPCGASPHALGARPGRRGDRERSTAGTSPLPEGPNRWAISPGPDGVGSSARGHP